MFFAIVTPIIPAIVFSLEMGEVSAIFIFRIKTTQPRSHGALTCKNAAFLMSFPR